MSFSPRRLLEFNVFLKPKIAAEPPSYEGPPGGLPYLPYSPLYQLQGCTSLGRDFHGNTALGLEMMEGLPKESRDLRFAPDYSRNPRTYLFSGLCSFPEPQLPPRSHRCASRTTLPRTLCASLPTRLFFPRACVERSWGHAPRRQQTLGNYDAQDTSRLLVRSALWYVSGRWRTSTSLGARWTIWKQSADLARASRLLSPAWPPHGPPPRYGAPDRSSGRSYPREGGVPAGRGRYLEGQGGGGRLEGP